MIDYTHCHCWADDLGPCCWCGDVEATSRGCVAHDGGPCTATRQARAGAARARWAAARHH